MNGVFGLQYQQASCRAFAFQPGLHMVRRSVDSEAGDIANRRDGVQQETQSGVSGMGGMGPQRSGDTTLGERLDGAPTLFGRGGRLSQAEIDFAVDRALFARQALEQQ